MKFNFFFKATCHYKVATKQGVELTMEVSGVILDETLPEAFNLAKEESRIQADQMVSKAEFVYLVITDFRKI